MLELYIHILMKRVKFAIMKTRFFSSAFAFHEEVNPATHDYLPPRRLVVVSVSVIVVGAPLLF